MKVLDRYILRAFFTNFLIALLVMVGLYVILDLFVNLDEFSKLPTDTTADIASKIIRYYAYNLFLYFSQLAGVVILASACFTLARFHRANEFTPVLASGVSLYRVALPIMIAAIGLNFLWLANQEFVIPRIADKLARTHDDTEGRMTYGVWFRPDQENALVSAAQFSPSRKTMRNVLIMKRDEYARLTDVIEADEAIWDDERQVWNLQHGLLSRYGGEGTESMVRQTVLEYPSKLTPKELALQQAQQWINFLSINELNQLQSRFPKTAEFVKVKHVRLTTIPLNMLLLALGIPFLLTRERPNILVAGGKCLLACGACFAAMFVCQNLDVAGMPFRAELPAWLPVIGFAPVAVVLMDGIKT